MRKIIKNRQIINDPWQHVADDVPVPAQGPFTVSLTRWKAERESLLGREDLGLRLSNDEDLTEISDDLHYFALIALDFPKFTDGRAYSQARLLRQRYGYEGEIRARGDVLRDQLFFMGRSGIDAYELREDRDLSDALRAFSDFNVTYQGAVDEPQPLYRRGR